MSKKRYISQYNDECHYCRHKIEHNGALGHACVHICTPGQLYCNKYDLYFEISELKKADIFCDKGRKK